MSNWPHSSYQKQEMHFAIIGSPVSYCRYIDSAGFNTMGKLPVGDTIIGEYCTSINGHTVDAIKIISSTKNPEAVGYYLPNTKGENGEQSLILYGDWTDDEIGMTDLHDSGAMLNVDEYIDFYRITEDGYVLAGTLNPGDRVYLKYHSGLKAMCIVSASREINGETDIIPDAIGSYILTAYQTRVGDSSNEAVPPGTNYGDIGLQVYTGIPDYDEHQELLKLYGKSYSSQEEYVNELSEGLRVQDLRGILGLPHQFTPITDPRIESNDSYGELDEFGRVYSEKIIKHIPLLLMTPGTPSFMQGYSREEREGMFNKLLNIGSDLASSLFSILGDDIERTGKYYSLKFAYTDYFNYVNAMLRSAAYFLELQDERIDGKKLGTLNWLYQTCNIGENNIFSTGNLDRFLGPNSGCIAFYADAGTSIDESFSNNSIDSQMAQTVNSLSDTAREVNFLVGNIGGMAGVNADLLGGATGSLDQTINGINDILGGSNILSNVLGQATTVIGGGKLIFPKIWSDSSFSRSYSCSMKLISPAGDKLSIFLNVLVPIYHLLGFCLPRQSANQAYFSPFLVRAYYKGLFNVDMGIISSLSITKGEEGEWSIDGIPTVANVNFEIEDLYSGMYMSPFSFDNDYSIMTNIQELDYIANSCGINVNDQEVGRTARMYGALGFASLKDKVTIGIFGGASQYFNQKLQNVFGKF